MRIFARFCRNEKAATAIEYGLIAGLIALVVITGITTVGTNLNSLFNRINTTLS